MYALRSFFIIVIIIIIIIITINIIIMIGIFMFRCQAEDSGLPPASHSEGQAAGTGSTSSVNQVLASSTSSVNQVPITYFLSEPGKLHLLPQ